MKTNLTFSVFGIILCSFLNAQQKGTDLAGPYPGIEAGQPSASFDSKYLFFTSGEEGKGNIYWVSVEINEELRPKE